MPDPLAPPPPCIFRVVVHRQVPMMKEIHENVVEHGELPPGMARFLAPVMGLKVKDAVTGVVHGINGIVGIDAETIEEAFEMLPERLKTGIPEIIKGAVKQLTAPIIVPAGKIPVGLDLNGRFKLPGGG